MESEKYLNYKKVCEIVGLLMKIQMQLHKIFDGIA